MKHYTLDDVIEQRQLKNYKEAKNIMINILNHDPDCAINNYQMAWCHDNLGEEKEAVPYYEKAIQIGLDRESLKGAYLGLGSTYRVLKEFQKSKETFEEAIEKFPDLNSIKVFYAMTLFNLNLHKEAMSILLNVINNTTNDLEIQKYERAIDYYKDNLNNFL